MGQLKRQFGTSVNRAMARTK